MDCNIAIIATRAEPRYNEDKEQVGGKVKMARTKLKEWLIAAYLHRFYMNSPEILCDIETEQDAVEFLNYLLHSAFSLAIRLKISCASGCTQKWSVHAANQKMWHFGVLRPLVLKARSSNLRSAWHPHC